MPLDKNCKDVPYLLGRMAAIIERSVELTPHQQNQAQEMPYIIFPTMIAKYHEAGSPLRSSELSELICLLPSDRPFPDRLALPEQGQFIIGHDHELADIFREQNRRKVAKAVKLKRVELDLTQEQLAEKAGITTQTVGNIESGNCNVSLDVLSSVMAVLGIKMAIE